MRGAAIFGRWRIRLDVQLGRHGTNVAKKGNRLSHRLQFQRLGRGKNSTPINFRVITDTRAFGRHSANRSCKLQPQEPRSLATETVSNGSSSLTFVCHCTGFCHLSPSWLGCNSLSDGVIFVDRLAIPSVLPTSFRRLIMRWHMDSKHCVGILNRSILRPPSRPVTLQRSTPAQFLPQPSASCAARSRGSGVRSLTKPVLRVIAPASCDAPLLLRRDSNTLEVRKLSLTVAARFQWRA